MAPQPLSPDNSNLLAASFVPALLRRQFAKQPERKAGYALVGEHAALLWVDICAFSPLCNRLFQDSSHGLERLSHILRDHYELLLQTITEFGGEPMVFAGDGLLAAWPGQANEMEQAVRKAAACAQAILAHRQVPDDRGDLLTLHVVISSGACQLLEMGEEKGRWMYTLLGEALSELNVAARNRAPGQILLSQRAKGALGEAIITSPVEHQAAILKQTITLNEATVPPAYSLPPEAAEALKAFVPPPVAYRLDVERLQWVAELRPVTVVFVELTDFSPDSADAAERLHQAYLITTPILLKYDGLLVQVWVDEKAANLLICFGPPPAAHTDNPARGIGIALDLRKGLAEAGFQNSIGVSTGKAYCGILGDDLLRQYTVLGDGVNLGARLAGLRKNRVFCDEATMKGAREVFDFLDSQTVSIKGQDHPVAIWEPVPSNRAKPKIARFPSIGREQDLAFLLDRWRAAAGGQAAAVLLEGESGIGKSQLLSDFAAQVAVTGKPVLAGLGDRVEHEIPYHAWRYIFTGIFGLDVIANLQTQQKATLQMLGPDLVEQASLLNVVLPLAFPESDVVRALSGQQRAAATHALLLKVIQKAASHQHLALVIDDAQWMDEASWRLAADVAQKIPHCFLLCLVQTFESNRESDLLMSDLLMEAGASRYSLQALSEKNQDKLICATLGLSEAPEEVRLLIRNLAKGNPFFCIELTQALLDEGAIVLQGATCSIASGVALDQLKLPETVQGAVRKRIDSLSPGPELALKVASVAGQRFATNLVQKVYPINWERELVPDHLQEDSRFGLIYDEMVDNFAGYSFNNSITREVAYEMMLSEQRQYLHQQSAEWFEFTFQENLHSHFVRLSHHWERAGEPEKAAEYLEKEAVRLFNAGYAKQSVDLGLRGVALLGTQIERDPGKIGPMIGENMGLIGAHMAGRAPADLMDLQQLEDQNIDRLLGMLLRIAPFAFQSQQIELFALISVTCLRMTLEHGNGLAAANVYSMYSAIHRAMTGDRTGAYAWSQLALKLDEQHQGALHARVAFVHSWFHNHWVQPLSSSLPLVLSAAKAGFAAGDIVFACFNLSGYVVYQAACGKPLQEVMETAKNHLALNGKRVINAAFHLVHELQVAKALAGLTAAPLLLTDEEYSEERDIASICQTEFGNQIGYYLVSKVKLHTHFGDWQGALEWAERVKPLLPAIEGQVAEIELVQFQTIAALVGAAADADLSAALSANAQTGVDTMKKWADLCPTNFAHKALLLEALQEGLAGDAGAAESLFGEAARKAEANGYLNDLALVKEYQVMVQHQHGQALTALQPALEAYTTWGADGKAAYLKRKYSFSETEPVL